MREAAQMTLRRITVVLLGITASLMMNSTQASQIRPEDVKQDLNVSYDRAFDASLETIRAMGGLSIDKKTEGWVRANWKHNNVDVAVEKISENSTRITVSSQKRGIIQKQYAQNVLASILKRVEEQPLWMH
jgi:hypothetical protein